MHLFHFLFVGRRPWDPSKRTKRSRSAPRKLLAASGSAHSSSKSGEVDRWKCLICRQCWLFLTECLAICGSSQMRIVLAVWKMQSPCCHVLVQSVCLVEVKRAGRLSDENMLQFWCCRQCWLFLTDFLAICGYNCCRCTVIFSARAWENWGFRGHKNWEKNWGKLGKIGQNWRKLGKTGRNWAELDEIGRKTQQNCSKLFKTGENWGKLGRTGQNWAKLEKIEFRWNGWRIFYAFLLVDQVHRHFFGARVRKLRF